MKLFFITIILLTNVIVWGQSFEGTLTYSIEIDASEELKNLGYTKEMVIEKMKLNGDFFDTLKITYKKGDYYLKMNRRDSSWAIYKSNKNKIYTMYADIDSNICLVFNANDNDIKFKLGNPDMRINDSITIIDSINCKSIQIKRNNGGTYEYFYNSSILQINPILFKNHKYEGFSNFLKISQSLPIKIVKDNTSEIITLKLINFKTESIDDSLFIIPKLIHDKELNPIKLSNLETMKIIK